MHTNYAHHISASNLCYQMNSIILLSDHYSIVRAFQGAQVDMIRYWGYPVEVHDVHTEDGYTLDLFRIPHGRFSLTSESPHLDCSPFPVFSIVRNQFNISF